MCLRCSMIHTGHENKNSVISMYSLYSFTVRSFYSPSAAENLHHLPNAAAKPVQLRLSSANPSAQVSVHLPRVRRHLSLRPFPIPCHQELPALHSPSGLPVSPRISSCGHYFIISSLPIIVWWQKLFCSYSTFCWTAHSYEVLSKHLTIHDRIISSSVARSILSLLTSFCG